MWISHPQVPLNGLHSARGGAGLGLASFVLPCLQHPDAEQSSEELVIAADLLTQGDELERVRSARPSEESIPIGDLSVQHPLAPGKE